MRIFKSCTMKKIFIICMSLYYFISIWGQDQILKYEVNNVGELQYNITDAREKDVKYVNLLSMEASLRQINGGKTDRLILHFGR